jgi:hypothetical protein
MMKILKSHEIFESFEIYKIYNIFMKFLKILNFKKKIDVFLQLDWPTGNEISSLVSQR